jgi:hypothetical protein
VFANLEPLRQADLRILAAAQRRTLISQEIAQRTGIDDAMIENSSGRSTPAQHKTLCWSQSLPNISIIGKSTLPNFVISGLRSLC